MRCLQLGFTWNTNRRLPAEMSSFCGFLWNSLPVLLDWVYWHEWNEMVSIINFFTWDILLQAYISVSDVEQAKKGIKGKEASWSGIIVICNSLILSEKAKWALAEMWNSRYNSVFNIYSGCLPWRKISDLEIESCTVASLNNSTDNKASRW